MTDQNHTETAVTENETQAKFPIVGIGASAGGLAAFEAFFSGMPDDDEPGMAFVLVQHLAPDHKSMLSDLVKRYTRMKVYEVEDGMVVKPNCTYIIPPGFDMAFMGGRLQLLDPVAPRGHRSPIDYFFRSLAQDQRERAIAIILSGTGSDGTAGIRTIKGEGGMVMAQYPGSAEYDSMPRSAIATGMVDYELPPAEMPAQLLAYVSKAYGKLPPMPESSRDNSALDKIFVLLRSQKGHDFSLYKVNTIKRRIERRMAVHQIDSIDRYVGFLQQTPEEVDALFQDMLINVTSFFRDPEAFEALEKHVIPRLFNKHPEGGEIRVWSVACSTGEEAYSIAMLLVERQELLKQRCKIQIFATDIDDQAIRIARAGVYPPSITADVTSERLSRHFESQPDGTFRIRKKIRDMLVFSEQNVTRDPPFSRLHLICCRNLLIYMSLELQKKLIPLFHYALNPGGYLFLGTSETVSEYSDLFAVVGRKQKIYQRKEDVRRAHELITRIQAPAGRQEQGPRLRARPDKVQKVPLREITEQTLLQHYAPTAALVNKDGDILYLHGRTGLYLEPSPGETGVNNIIKMARDGLHQELAVSLRKSVTEKEIVTMSNLLVRTNGDRTPVNLTVRPQLMEQEPSEKPAFYVVILEKALQKEELRVRQDPTGNTDTNTLIEKLKNELRMKEEYLQATREQLETANEELTSSNEEMQSINEELHSTNEELETSKEELQSVNEELVTVNTELQNKVADLTQLNNDMNNLMAGTGIATIYLDNNLKIMRFTPTATRIINLIQSDVGRPISHIVSNLKGYDALSEDIQRVLESLSPKTREVQTVSGDWYAMRIQPYRTLDNVIEGAVLTFAETNELKRIQQDLQEKVSIFIRMFEQHAAVMLIIDPADGSIVDANEAAVEFYGWPRKALKQKKLHEIQIDRAADSLDDQDRTSQSWITHRHRLADGSVREVELLSTRISADGAKWLYTIVHDATATKREVPNGQ